jgi:hypothetical protein
MGDITKVIIQSPNGDQEAQVVIAAPPVGTPGLVVYPMGAGGLGTAVTIADGADVAEGSTIDVPWAGAGADPATVISLLKKIASAGGSAVTIADGADVAEGATTDAESAAGNGTVVALLKRLRTLLQPLFDSIGTEFSLTVHSQSFQIGGAAGPGGEWHAVETTNTTSSATATGLVVRTRTAMAAITEGAPISNDGLGAVLAVRNSTTGLVTEPEIRTDAPVAGSKGIVVREAVRGQGTIATSIPVVIAGDQTPVQIDLAAVAGVVVPTGLGAAGSVTNAPRVAVSNDSTLADRTVIATLGALNDPVIIAVDGLGDVSFDIPAGLTATVAPQWLPNTAGATWLGTQWHSGNGNMSAQQVLAGAAVVRSILVPGGAAKVRVIVTSYTGGSADGTLNAGVNKNIVPAPQRAAGGAIGSNLMPIGGSDGSALAQFLQMRTSLPAAADIGAVVREAAQGQATMALSRPVVLASDQLAIPVAATASAAKPEYVEGVSEAVRQTLSGELRVSDDKIDQILDLLKLLVSVQRAMQLQLADAMGSGHVDPYQFLDTDRTIN